MSHESPIAGNSGRRLRLFVGVAVDDRVRQNIAKVQAQLQESLGKLSWVAADNLHLTLKFLGNVKETKVAPIADQLTNALSNQREVSLGVKGLGVFPDLRWARTLWAGLVSGGLAPLAECVERGLEPLGFERERRPFQPHLTIGRWRVPEKDTARLRAELESWQEHDFGAFSASDVSLFHSALSPAGAVYSVLEHFHLTAKVGESEN